MANWNLKGTPLLFPYSSACHKVTIPVTSQGIIAEVTIGQCDYFPSAYDTFCFTFVFLSSYPLFFLVSFCSYFSSYLSSFSSFVLLLAPARKATWKKKVLDISLKLVGFWDFFFPTMASQNFSLLPRNPSCYSKHHS